MRTWHKLSLLLLMAATPFAVQSCAYYEDEDDVDDDKTVHIEKESTSSQSHTDDDIGYTERKTERRETTVQEYEN